MARFRNPVPKFLYNNGTPLANGLLYFYEPNTAIEKNTYADEGLTIANTNPVELYANGDTPNIFYSGDAKVILTDSAFVQLWERDPVTAGEWSIVSDPIFLKDHNSDGSHIVYESIADLRASTLTPFDGQKISLIGGVLAGDKGGADYYWNSASVETDNSSSIIKITSITTGRFKLVRNVESQVYESIAALRASTLTPFDGQVVNVIGHTYRNDRGGGDYHWDEASKTADNNGTIIKVTSITTGRWVRTIGESGAFYTSWFGVNRLQSASANLASFKESVSATPTGGLLIHPAESDYTDIDTTGGLTASIVINKAMVIRIDGMIKANFSAIQANPPYIFNVTADDVTITGTGWIEGDGTIDATNTGNQDTTPGLIRVTGDRFKYSLEMRSQPKYGILLYSCNDAKIFDSTFTGGPDDTWTPGETAYFCVYVYSGSGHKIYGNQFIPDGAASGGGRVVNAIFTNGVTGMSCTGNTAVDVHEKLMYHNGADSFISGNYLNGLSSTDSIRCVGSNNTISNNVGIDCYAGITVRDGFGNKILNNTFLDVEQTGIVVGMSNPAYADGFSNTVISGNRCNGRSGSVALGSGIQFVTDNISSYDIVITNNSFSNFSDTSTRGCIRVEATSPHRMIVTIENNRTRNAYNGYVLRRLNRGKVSNNDHAGTNVSGYGILLADSVDVDINSNKLTDVGLNGVALTGVTTGCRIYNNYVRDASNIGIAGYTGNDITYYGNTYTDEPLQGTATVGAVVTYTVTHGGVAPEAFVQLNPYSVTASVSMITRGYGVSSISGSDFTIRTGTGGAWAGTEQFYYNIIQ